MSLSSAYCSMSEKGEEEVSRGRDRSRNAVKTM